MIRAASIGGGLLLSSLLLAGCAAGAPSGSSAGSTDCSESSSQLGIGDAQTAQGVSVTVPEGFIDC